MTIVNDIDPFMKLGLRPGDNVLVAHAHPDDESMANAALITGLNERGICVHVAIATDGPKSTVGDPVWVQAGGRRIEAIRALWRLDVPLYRQHFFGLEDGQLEQPRQQRLLELEIGSLLVKQNIKALFTPGAEGFDGHRDHIAVHQAALASTIHVENARMPLTVWAASTFGRTAVVITVDSQAKRSALGDHDSQWRGAGENPPPPKTAAALARYRALLRSEGYSRVRPDQIQMALGRALASVASKDTLY